jgi:limonene-1,2-epoxide hydrolase
LIPKKTNSKGGFFKRSKKINLYIKAGWPKLSIFIIEDYFYMQPKELLKIWVELFNRADYNGLADLYAEDAVNHQTPNGIVKGKDNIRQMMKYEFEQYQMVCIIENIFEEGNVGILEWKDPNGLRGCGFFWIDNDRIIYQRGYWDKLSFLNNQSGKQ